MSIKTFLLTVLEENGIKW